MGKEKKPNLLGQGGGEGNKMEGLVREQGLLRHKTKNNQCSLVQKK